MKTVTAVVLTTSILVNGVTILAYIGVRDENAKLKAYSRKANSWSKTMLRIYQSHLANGGDLRIDKKTSEELDAYLLFSANDMI